MALADVMVAGLAAALQRHDWRAAYDLLKEALAARPDDPELLVRLAECAKWLQLHDEAIDARERAYQLFYGADKPVEAARVAMELHWDYLITRVQLVVAGGWLERAATLLGSTPTSAAHAELRLRQGMMTADPQAALQRYDEAIALATRFGAHDVEMAARMWKGSALIGAGELGEGRRLQDTALAAAVGGELGPLATVVIYCKFIGSAENLGDVERAGEWSEIALRYCEKNALTSFPGQCHLHRARISLLRGRWDESIQEARRAAEAIGPSSPLFYGLALGEIAEVRRRLGDLEGAQDLARQAVASGATPEPVLSLIAADREGPEAAFYRLERELRAIHDRFARAKLIPAFSEVAIASGKADVALDYATELERLAELAGTAVLRASARGTRGRLQFAGGDLVGARGALEESVRAWAEAGAPFEAARDRIALASVLLATGDRIGADAEAREAARVLENLGAKPEAARAQAVAARAVAQPPMSKISTLMFTDVAASTALLEAIGDDAYRDLIAWLDVSVRRIFVEHAGREVDHRGDGFFVAFDSAADAVECAIALQRHLLAHRKEHGYAPAIRIGLHTGSVLPSTETLQGAAVHRAARISALAEGGRILASREVLEAAGRNNVPLRRVALRGVPEEVEIGELDWSPS